MTSGKWMVLDSNTREIYGLFQDGAEAIHTVRYSPDGKFLALGSRDGILYIYQVSDDSKKYHRMGRCLVSSPFSHSTMELEYLESKSGKYFSTKARKCQKFFVPF